MTTKQGRISSFDRRISKTGTSGRSTSAFRTISKACADIRRRHLARSDPGRPPRHFGWEYAWQKVGRATLGRCTRSRDIGTGCTAEPPGVDVAACGRTGGADYARSSIQSKLGRRSHGIRSLKHELLEVDPRRRPPAARTWKTRPLILRTGRRSSTRCGNTSASAALVREPQAGGRGHARARQPP